MDKVKSSRAVDEDAEDDDGYVSSYQPLISSSWLEGDLDSMRGLMEQDHMPLWSTAPSSSIDPPSTTEDYADLRREHNKKNNRISYFPAYEDC